MLEGVEVWGVWWEGMEVCGGAGDVWEGWSVVGRVSCVVGGENVSKGGVVFGKE